MAITSFYHAIYKRLWAVGQASNAHINDQTSFGGFSLRSPGEPNGIFGTIGAGQFAGQKPLKANDNAALKNPLYVLLLRSLDAVPQTSTVVNGETWPVMPFPFNNSIA